MAKPDLKVLNTACTVTEATQIAIGVASDMLDNYSAHQYPMLLSMSIQIELLRDVVINAGLITEEEYKEAFESRVAEFQEKAKENELAMAKIAKAAAADAEMVAKAGDIEVVKH